MAGASGFVGQRLCTALDRGGHEVVAMTRNPAGYRGTGTPVRGDVQEPATLEPAMAGCQAGYYLVHSLQDADFERIDATGATAFGEAAARAGLHRIVYLSGLGDDADDLSAHLRSRREVENLLGTGGVPVTVIRAGIIVGHGGISWELTRQLVEHLPVMITPQWVATRTQPIAVDDVVTYLTGVLEPPEASDRVFEVGGRSDPVLDDAAPRRRHREPPAAPAAGAAAHPLAVLAVADPGHRHRHRNRPGARRFHDQRGGRARPVDQGPGPDPAQSYDDAVRAALRERRQAAQVRP